MPAAGQAAPFTAPVGPPSDRDVLIAILVELRVQTRMLSEEFTRRNDEVLSLRTDEEASIGYMHPTLSQKDD